MKKKAFLKSISSFLIVTFLSLQISWAQEYQLTTQPLAPEKSIQENSEPHDSQTTSSQPASSIDFLQSNSPLSRSAPEENDEAVIYDHDLYSFEAALDLIRPEFAAAIPIESLSKEDLEVLRSLDVEVALVAVKGMKFILTSGNLNEIRTHSEVNELLEGTSFFAHTHPDETEADGPSEFDLLSASSEEEYLLTQDEILSYTKDGVQKRNISNEEFLSLWNTAAQNEQVDEAEARDWANEFIYQMDRLNQHEEELKIEALRTAGTVAPTAGLTSANLTSFSGSPWPLIMGGSSASTAIVQGSSTQFQLNYDVTQPGSRSGAYVSFDNPTTASVEVSNLSTLTELTIGVSGPAGSTVKFEIEDSLGAKSDVTLINLSATMQYYKISKTLFTGIDWTKVKGLIYSIDSTLTTALTGTLTIQTKTLLYSSTSFTSLPNSPYLAVSSGSTALTQVAAMSTTSFKLNYDVTQAGSVSGASIVLDNPSTTSVEYGNLSSQTQFTFALSGPTSGKVKLEFEDTLGAKSSVILSGLNSSTQYYMVGKDSFAGLDWTRVKQINFIVDSFFGNPVTGTITIQTKTLTYGTALLTDTGQAAKIEVAPGSTSGTVARYISNSLASATFVLSGAGTKSGIAITFDDSSTASTIETKDFSALSQFIFSVSGPGGGKIRVELEDITGAKASAILSGLNSSTLYYYSVNAAAFSGIDRSQIRRIIFSLDPTLTSLTSGSFQVGVKSLYFDTGLLTALPSFPESRVLAGSQGASTVVSEASTLTRLNFDVNTTGSFAGTSLSFDDQTTVSVEAQDLSSASAFNFSLQAGTNYLTKVKVEVEDSLGAKSSFLVSSVATILQYFTLQKSAFSGIDWTKVKSFNFIVDKTMISSSSGYIGWVQVGFNAPVTSFQESQGLLVIEGEHAYQNITNTSRLWEYRTAVTGFAGDGYLYSGPDVGNTYDTGSFTTYSPELRYKVNIQTPGTYYVWLRGYAPNTSGDSVHVGLDGIASASSDKISSFTAGSFSWSKATMDGPVATLNIATSGEHTLNIWMREDGFVLDKIILTNDAAYTPAGIGPQESPRVSAITVNPPAVNPIPQYTNQTTVILSGTKPTNTSIWINGVQAVALDSLTTWSYSAALAEGSNPLQITTKDAGGNQSTIVTASTIRDTVIPTGSVNVNSGALYAVLNSVTLNLSAGDGTGSGIDQMSFSNDNVNWTAPEIYAASKTYTLPSGDGMKTVYVKYFDKAGNVSTVYSKQIMLDTVSPAGTVKINSDAVYTNSTVVTLTLTGTDATSGVDQMRFTTDAGVTWSDWEAFSVTKSLSLSSGDGVKTVVAQLKDKSGLLSAMFADGIILDTAPPSGTIQINGGAQYINQTLATLNLSAADGTSGLSQMSFSADNVTWTAPESYKTTKSWTFPSGDGNKTIYVKFSDQAGLWSSPISVTVLADFTVPTGSININSGASFTNSTAATLNLSASDGTGSGVDTMSFSTDNLNWSAPETYAASKTFNLSAGDGAKTVYVKYFDKTGNVSAVYSKSVTLDTVAPAGSVSINAGAQYAASTSVNLTLTGTDVTSGIDQMRFSTDGINWSSWEAFALTKSGFLLPNGDGTKTVSVQLKDKSGLVSSSFSDQITLDTAKPTISSMNTSALTSNAVTISWTTDETSDTQIEYGLTTSYGSSTVLNQSSVTAHSQALSTLQASTLYHYRVKSRDPAGNLQTSSDFTFTTLAPSSEAGLSTSFNFDNIVGVAAADQSGNGNNGTLVNGVAPSVDHPNTASNTGSLSFDGVDDYVEIPNSASLNFGSTDFTIALWIRPDTVAALKQGILNKSDGTNGYRLITSDTDGDRLKFIRGAYFADGIQSNDAVLTAGVWQHVAVVISSNQVTFYVNGASQGSGVLKSYSASTSTNLFIGQRGYSASSVSFFDGNMDELKMYNRALTQTEIQNLATTVVVDTVPPTISAVVSKSMTSSGAEISWTTDEPSDSQVEYRIQGTAAWSATAINSSLLTSHSVTLTGLSPSTIYEYQVKSKDAAGNLATQAAILSFTTLDPPDTTAPAISSVTTSNLAATGVTINWTTNEAGDTQIEYGLTTAYGFSTVLSAALVTAHSQALSSLQASTLYHYRVKSRDQAGNLQTSGDFMFTTPALLDTAPPMISVVTSTGITSTAATITWTTNEASDSQVWYRLQGTAVWTSSSLNPSMVTNHSVTLTGLQAESTYEYRVKSKDAAANEQVSIQAAFTTRASQTIENGHTVYHVYSGESIQQAIDRASEGDAVHLHSGTYHEHITLKAGVNLTGEDAKTTILHGDFQTQTHVIRALGNNRIENLTISGSGPYSGAPSSAIRVEGDNVKIRDNRLIDNQGYGIFVWSWSASNVLIEENFFQNTYLGVQLPKTGNTIRYNTFVGSSIAINILMGTAPTVSNNIITGSTFQSIYEYASGMDPTRGYAVVQNNTFFNNVERGSYYGSATPPAVETQTQGNLIQDPQFTNPAQGDYSVLASSPSFGRGAFLPQALSSALARASSFNVSNTIESILEGNTVIGYRILYGEDSREEFYNDGTSTLDITPPSIVILSTVTLTNQASYEFIYSINGVEQTETRTLSEGENALLIEVTDMFGNKASTTLIVTLDTVKPVITGVTPRSLTSNEAVIRWTTDKPSDTEIEYGLTTSYGLSTTLSASFVTIHAQVLSALQANTLYHYRVKSRDQAGNLQVSEDFTFTTANPAPPEVGLNTYFDFENIAGTTATDNSGNGNSGTLVNGVAVSTDHPTVNFSNSGSLSFDGVNDYVQVANSSSLNFGAGNFTISLWIRPDTVTTAKQAIVDKTDGTNGYRLITSDADGDRLKFIRGALFAEGVQSNDGVLRAGVWQHVAVAINGNQVTFYVNGINQGGGTLAAKQATAATNLFLGQKGYSGSSVNFFDGNMDDVRIYNRALSVSEVQSLAQGNLRSTLPPVVVFTSSSSTNNSDYTLAYTVDGVSYTETWRLAPGVNDLLVRASVSGKPSAFVNYTVNLNQTEPTAPPIPAIPALSQNLVSVTTDDGLILKYDQGVLVSIEKPGDYELFLPELDLSGNLIGGVLLFANGDKLLFQNSKAIYKVSFSGDKTYYDIDGLVRAFETVGGERTRFAYRLDTQGEILSVLTEEFSAGSLYEMSGKPVWIIEADGSQVRYENGFLKTYVDSFGNLYDYEITKVFSGSLLTGYRSDLTFVIPSGSSILTPIAQILAQLPSYPNIKQTLENKIATEVHYDVSGQITQFVSGKGEDLRLQSGLPISLDDGAGNLTLFSSEINSSGVLTSLNLNEPGLGQSFDSNGNLKSIRLSDETSFEVSSLTLNEIALSDGSLLTALAWNGSSLTGFTRTKPDGSKEVYQNSNLIEIVDAQGNVTSFVRFGGADHRDTFTTQDGRTYKIIEYQNALGLTEQTMELLSIDLADGGRLEFENGIPKRYIQTKTVTLNPFEVPELPAGEYFVPLITLPDAELRSVTIDQTGTILSGEILFNDGTQYFIKDNELYKQITPYGQVVEFGEVPPDFVPPVGVPAEPLTPAEIAYRNELVGAQLNYFVNGIGIDPDTGFPLDNYNIQTSTPSDYSQATLAGFWAEILSAVAAGDLATAQMTRTVAFNKLVSLLTNLRTVQTQIGWNGMIAFFDIVKVEVPILDQFGNPTGQTRTDVQYRRKFNQVGIGDNLNLSVSLSTVIGALSDLNLDATLDAKRDQIIGLANQILVAQDPGYVQFYDSGRGQFRMAYDVTTGQFTTGYMDRIFNEFRTGLIWLASRNSTYQPALDKLQVAIRPFTASDGTEMEIAVPFDGGAFQMFWPLMYVDETQYPEFEVALGNFLYAQAEFINENNIPGLLSAGAEPGNGYNGKIGLPGASETDDELVTDVGSLYGTATAFGIAPHYALQLLKNIETAFPGVRTSLGFKDSLRVQATTQTDPGSGEITVTYTPAFAESNFGIDQASFILALLGKSRDYFANYLNDSGTKTNFDALYRSMEFGLDPVAKVNPAPPAFGSVTSLYTGASLSPDGLSPDLVKRPAFVRTISDPDFGEGIIFDYLTPKGSIHHTEIEFTKNDGTALKMNLQEYLLSTKKPEAGRSIFDRYVFDLFELATSHGEFYTVGQGYANSAITRDPAIGEVRHVRFDLKTPAKPVGLWFNYNALDLSRYHYLSIPIRLGSQTPPGGLKFELKGTGGIFVTGTLASDWQYFEIPIIRTSDTLYELAISILSPDGEPVSGELYLGPLSGIKVRTDKSLDWQAILGKTDAQVRSLLLQNVANQITGGGTVEAQETLEDFTIDSEGKLVDGVLKRADGSIQYFQDGKLTKWILRNGKTILYENGLATFIMDLARGKLEEGRFYYDENLRGEIKSFVVQDNDRKRVFGADGKLKTIVDGGNFYEFQNGALTSITTPTGVLTALEFAEDGRLLRAHVVLNDTTEFDIDQTGEQMIEYPDGVKLYYQVPFITAIETPTNGRTDFTYDLDASGRVLGVNATFGTTTMPLFDYLRLPGREIERSYILRETPLSVIPISSDVGGFSFGTPLAGEITYGLNRAEILSGSSYELDVQLRQGLQSGDQMGYMFKYVNTSGPTLGAFVKNPTAPVTISNYDFLTVTLRQYNMDWNQDFNLKLKTPTSNTLYTFEVDNTVSDYKTYAFSLAGRVGTEGEITLEALRESGGVGKTGIIYIQDISYASLQDVTHPLWEDLTQITDRGIQNVSLETKALLEVAADIVSGKTLRYEGLVDWLNTPTRMVYTDKSVSERGQLIDFIRFDGSRVELEGQNVTKVIFPDGTVNEYSAIGNQAAGVIQGPGTNAGDQNNSSYSYGALRQVRQPDGRVYTFSYEFDSDGKEISVIHDSVTGDERRFKGGKLIRSTSANGLETQYGYENGELTSAEIFYKNRVLDSTTYHFANDVTQVTDELGTTWYYDRDGNLIKHLTKDGYLFEYLDYTQSLFGQVFLDPADYKNQIFQATDLRAVRLRGYETSDGSKLIFNDDNLGEIYLATGEQAVNLVFDSEGRIKAGQIQFADGAVIVIDDYLPVSGRRATGEVFTIDFPEGGAREILINPDGSFQNIRIEINGITYLYDIEGKLVQASFPDHRTLDFTYLKDGTGQVISYETLEKTRLAFRGVIYPKKADLETQGTGGSRVLKLSDEAGELIRQTGSGFVIGILKGNTGEWDSYGGSFSSAADRLALKNLLLGVKEGDYVAISISDSALKSAGTSAEREELFTLFESLGAGGIRTAAQTDNDWFFFGTKGLDLGEGSETVKTFGSIGIVSTEVQTRTQTGVTAGEIPTLGGVPLLLEFPTSEYQELVQFLARYEAHKPDLEIQTLTVYNSEDEIVLSRRLDGVTSYYENGKVRETFDENGELLYTYEYDADGNTVRITIVKARIDFEKKIEELREKLEQEKFDALYRLAWQDEVARQKIAEEVEEGLLAIDNGIAQLEGQRFQEVQMCKKRGGFAGFFGGKKCWTERVEVPQVASAINQLQGERVNLLQRKQEELANIASTVQAKKDEVENAVSDQMLELDQQEAKFRSDVLHQEIEPILYDFYRKILGRDPSTTEINQWIDQYKTAGAIDTVNLASTLNALTERQTKLDQIAAIISNVETFLDDYLAQTTDQGRQTLLNQLQLNSSEVVSLDRAEVDEILDWLRSRDLHFGQSAFLALKEMLASKGATVPLETLGKETILIDILTGSINRFTEGELLISVFALNRTAKIHGQNFSGVKYSFDDLRALYSAVCPVATDPCSLRVIAHVAEDHFVVITKVTDTEVSYRETTKGASGEEVTVPKDEFIKVWANSNGAGYLVVPTQNAISSKIITDEEAQRIRGSFFFAIFFFLAAIIAKVAAVVYAVVTFVVSTVLAIVTTVLNTIVNTLGFIFAKITEGITLLGKGFFNLGKLLYQGIKFVGRFVMKGFQFLKEGFTKGLSKLGSGISKIKGFLLNPTGKPIVDALGHNILGPNGEILRHFSTQQIIARNLVAAGLGYGTSKGLEGLGLNPTLANLAGAFVGAGFLGVGSATSSFIKSGLQGLLLQGVSEIGLKLDLPPPITGALSIFASTALTSYFNPNLTLKDGLIQIIPQVSEKLAIGGVNLLGRSLGISPILSQLIGLPISSLVGGIVGLGAGTNPAGIWNTIRNSIVNGFVQLGLNHLVSQLPIPTEFKQAALSSLAYLTFNFISSAEQQQSVIGNLLSNFSKFGKQVQSALGILLSFGAKVAQGFGSLTKQGFAKAVDFFSNLFTPETREKLVQAGNGRIESVILNNTVILGQTAQVSFGGVNISWDQSTGELSVLDGKRSQIFDDLWISDSGELFSGRYDYYEQLDDGSILTQSFLDNQLQHVNLSKNSASVFDIQVLNNYTPITFDSLGNLENGQVNYASGQVFKFLDRVPIEVYNPANSIGITHDPFRSTELPSETLLLPNLGITAGDLRGLNFVVAQDLVSGTTQVRLETSATAQPGVLDNLFNKLRSGVESFETSFERLTNRLLLFGPYTNEELAAHKALEVQKVLADPGKIYILSAKTNAAVSYAIRSSTYSLGDIDNVNHTALAFQNPDDGQVYVLDIEMGRDGTTDLRLQTLQEWSTKYVDIQAQDFPINQIQADSIRDNVVFGTYVNRDEMQPKLDMKYDYFGAFFGGGLNLPISGPNSTAFCSSLVYDIIRQGTDIFLPGISDTPDPNELRHAIEEYQQQVSP